MLRVTQKDIKLVWTWYIRGIRFGSLDSVVRLLGEDNLKYTVMNSSDPCSKEIHSREMTSLIRVGADRGSSYNLTYSSGKRPLKTYLEEMKTLNQRVRNGRINELAIYNLRNQVYDDLDHCIEEYGITDLSFYGNSKFQCQTHSAPGQYQSFANLVSLTLSVGSVLDKGVLQMILGHCKSLTDLIIRINRCQDATVFPEALTHHRSLRSLEMEIFDGIEFEQIVKFLNENKYLKHLSIIEGNHDMNLYQHIQLPGVHNNTLETFQYNCNSNCVLYLWASQSSIKSISINTHEMERKDDLPMLFGRLDKYHAQSIEELQINITYDSQTPFSETFEFITALLRQNLLNLKKIIFPYCFSPKDVEHLSNDLALAFSKNQYIEQVDTRNNPFQSLLVKMNLPNIKTVALRSNFEIFEFLLANSHLESLQLELTLGEEPLTPQIEGFKRFLFAKSNIKRLNIQMISQENQLRGTIEEYYRDHPNPLPPCDLTISQIDIFAINDRYNKI